MTTITITGKQPGKTDVTISSTVNPAVKTVVPVTVLSRNLLSYGPASGNGLTATVNSDGSLHVKGTASSQWAGIRWTFPCPVHGAVILSRPKESAAASDDAQRPVRLKVMYASTSTILWAFSNDSGSFSFTHAIL